MTLFSLLIACSTPEPLPADAALPEIHDSGMRVAVVEADIAAPRDFFLEYRDVVSLEELVEPVEDIPMVTHTELLNNHEWAGVGTRRRVFLDDGSETLEEILADSDDEFEYVVWGYTSSAARHVQYGHGRFVYTETDDGTHVEWTYRFRPRGITGKVGLGGFVRNTWTPWMEGFMTNLAEGAAEAYAGER